MQCLCDLIVQRHEEGHDHGIIMLPVGAGGGGGGLVGWFWFGWGWRWFGGVCGVFLGLGLVGFGGKSV